MRRFAANEQFSYPVTPAKAQGPKAEPLISCVMPTTAKRKQFFPQALRCWYDQTYQNKELIIVCEDDISDVIPDDPRIRIIKTDPSLTLGAKRNAGAAVANGEFIAHWDDDDWYYSGRLSECVVQFEDYRVGIVGYYDLRFHDAETQITRYFTFMNEGAGDWTRYQVSGTSLMYRKRLWERNKFREIPKGEDTFFQRDLFSRGVTSDISRRLRGDWKCIAGDHAFNTDLRKGAYTIPTLSNFKPLPFDDTINILANANKPIKIVMGVLSWNQSDLTIENTDALLKEAWRLRCCGYNVEVVVCDNNSSDDTQKKLKAYKNKVHLILNKENFGCGGGKNFLIDYAVEAKADYLLIMDCDGTIVPGSVMEMLRWMKGNAAISIGPKPLQCTDDPEQATKWCPPITKATVYPFCATAGYGLFRMSILSKFRFDKNLGPGWGGEDDDLAMQMQGATGLYCYWYDNTIWLHRHPHNSKTHLAKEGMDVDANYQARIKYLIKKWDGNTLFEPVVATLKRKVK